MFRVFLLIMTFAVFAAGPARSAGNFKDWAALVVAADYRAHSGAASEIFDNARRDISRELITAGFSPGNVIQASVRPQLYPDSKPLGLDPPLGPFNAFAKVTERTKSGCLLYFSSHGSPEGIVFGENGLLPPSAMAGIVEDTCGARPTIVMISACFSGVFVPALSAPNRMIVTAARPDRTSFGCGEDDVYPYFDLCLLQKMPSAPNFDALAFSTRDCVARRELELGMAPPSEPQIWIGAQIKPLLPLLGLAKEPPG